MKSKIPLQKVYVLGPGFWLKNKRRKRRVFKTEHTCWQCDCLWFINYWLPARNVDLRNTHTIEISLKKYVMYFIILNSSLLKKVKGWKHLGCEQMLGKIFGIFWPFWTKLPSLELSESLMGGCRNKPALAVYICIFTRESYMGRKQKANSRYLG